MYNFIFYLMLTYRRSPFKDFAIFDGTVVVSVLILFHVYALVLLAKGVFGMQYINHSGIDVLPSTARKLAYFSMTMLFPLAVYRYYKRNCDRIIEAYSGRYPRYNRWWALAHVLIMIATSGAACIVLMKVFK